jgi:hypothetical protein
MWLRRLLWVQIKTIEVSPPAMAAASSWSSVSLSSGSVTGRRSAAGAKAAIGLPASVSIVRSELIMAI